MVMLVVLGGIWIGYSVMRYEREQDKRELERELPDLELVGLSKEELYAREDFKPHPGMPQSWDDIHLRLYAEPGGIFLKFLRCTMSPTEVEPTNPAAFQAGMFRRRETDELPPAWWPGMGDPVDDPAWAIPEWWRPESGSGIGSWWAVPDRDTVIGAYLHYDPENNLLHYWEWRRQHERVTPPSGLEDQPVVDRIATALSRELAGEGHPVVHGDWLEALELRGARIAALGPDMPRGLTSVDALLRPKQAMRYLLALHGIDRAAAEALLSDLPMRPVEPDSPPPAADWDFALPTASEAGLPPWFDPATGPRWRYELRRPGSGVLDEARWAAWDATERTLYVWDWRGRRD